MGSRARKRERNRSIILILLVIVFVLMLREFMLAFGFIDGFIIGGFILSYYFVILALIAIVLMWHFRRS